MWFVCSVGADLTEVGHCLLANNVRARDGIFPLEFTARGLECANTPLELSACCEHWDLTKDSFLGAKVPQG